MDEILKTSAPMIFSGVLLALLGTLAKILTGIAKDLKELKMNVPILTERLSGLHDRVILLEQRRQTN